MYNSVLKERCGKAHLQQHRYVHRNKPFYFSWQLGASVVQLVAHWTTDHYHLGSNLDVGIPEGCFMFDFASLTLEVTLPI